MRFRIPLFVVLACSVAWMGCDEQAGPEGVQGPAPSFASGGPTPGACDLKDLPLRDYFPKAALKDVNLLVRDLSDACAVGDQEGPEGALANGFSIFEAVQAALAGATDYGAGGEIVARVWAAMQYNGGLLVACSDCAPAAVDDSVVAQALKFGAFGVRGGSDGYVVSPGDYPDIWGIEPDGGVWDVPLGKALIYGVPLYLDEPGLALETPLIFGYDWNVAAWWANPTEKYLLVGTCVPSNGANLPLVSHEPTVGSPTLLPKGRTGYYCGTGLTLGSRLLNLASLALPLWPQPLNASAMVGVSGSGKAREFSPFHQYDVAPYAAVTFTPLPSDGVADEDLCTYEDNPYPCTVVTWLTEGDSRIASSEKLRFTTEANSSSWGDTYICVAPVFGGSPDLLLEECTEEDPAQGPWEPIEVECDATATAHTPCEGLAVTRFISNKTGSHRICVSGAGGREPSGLAFDACTPTFNIRP